MSDMRTSWQNEWLVDTRIELMGTVRRSAKAGRADLFVCADCEALFWPEITEDGIYPSRYFPDTELGAAGLTESCDCGLIASFYPRPDEVAAKSRWAGIEHIFDSEETE